MPLSGHDDVALFNDVANDAVSIQNRKLRHNFKFETMGKLISRTPGSRLLISKIVSEYDQEIPQSQTADNPLAP